MAEPTKGKPSSPPTNQHRKATPLGSTEPKGDIILAATADEKDKAMAENIRAMLRMTIAPTIIHGGVKENIIPSECEAVFDCRILPGQNATMDEIKGLLKEADLKTGV